MTSDEIKIAIDHVPDLNFDFMFEETRLDIATLQASFIQVRTTSIFAVNKTFKDINAFKNPFSYFLIHTNFAYFCT